MPLTISELREKCQTKSPQFRSGYPPWEWLDRHISIYITRALIGTRVTANQVSLVNIFIALAAASLLVFGGWIAFVGALLLRFVWLVLDCVDGELARFRGSVSVRGQYLDRAGKFFVEPYIFIALGVGLYLGTPNPIFLILAAVAAVSALHLKLSVYTLYISLFDEHFATPGGSEGATSPVSPPPDSTDAMPHLLPLQSRMYALVQTFLPGGFGMLWLLLGVTLLDAIPALPGFQFTYLYILVYGIATPVAAGVLFFMVLRSNYPEKLSEQVGRWKK